MMLKVDLKRAALPWTQCSRPRRVETPAPRQPLKSVAKLARFHPGHASHNQDSADQQFKHYIHQLQLLNSKGAIANGQQHWEDPFHVGVHPGSDSESGSLTETEAEEVRQLISDLQGANSQLQAEMDRLVVGLADLLHNIKHTSKSDKALLAAMQPTLNRPATTNGSSTIPSSSLAAPASSSDGTAATVSCVMQHPGALCCTRSTVREDPNGGAITISLETTAKATDDAAVRGLLSNEQLAGLAAQALLSAAAEHLCSRTRVINAHARPEGELLSHDELCAVLQSGEIVEAKSNPVVSQFGHESFIVQLQNEVTGKRVRAIFKPRVEGDAEGWHRTPMEWVAYRLNLLLGLDYVPPVAYRTGGVTFKVTDQETKEVSFSEGAMMYFVEDAHQLRCFPEAQWGSPPEPKELLLSNTRILDTLLHNSDRHHGHFLLGRHWCQGSYNGDRWVGELRPCLIDHAASFRADAEVSMTHENAFRTGPVRCVASGPYLRLRFLDYAALAAEFRGMLTEEELRGMVKRRDAVLRYLDGLVVEQGYGATVIETK